MIPLSRHALKGTLMKKQTKWLLVGCFVLICLLAFAPQVRADVGGGVDHHANDWGGDLGGGFNFGIDDGFSIGPRLSINPFVLFYFLEHPLGLVVLLVILGLSYAFKRRSHPSGATRSTSSQPSRPIQTEKEKDLDRLLEKDPNFSKPQFLLRVSDVFIALQQAWTAKDWRSIRPFESNALYAQHERQLQVYIDQHRTNVVEDISVLNTWVESYEEDHENDYLNAIIEARYSDYVVDDLTEKVVQGEKDKRYIMTYRMQFMRKKGVLTQSTTQTTVTECPNCGAPLSINQNGICDYCGSEVTTGANQWVLTKYQPLQQRTA